MRCAVKWCVSNRDGRDEGLSFHRFPKNPYQRELWTEAVRLERHDPDWKPTNYTVICSMHFREEQIVFTKCKTRLLTKDAIPICTMVFSTENKEYEVKEDDEYILPHEINFISVDADCPKNSSLLPCKRMQEETGLSNWKRRKNNTPSTGYMWSDNNCVFIKKEKENSPHEDEVYLFEDELSTGSYNSRENKSEIHANIGLKLPITEPSTNWIQRFDGETRTKKQLKTKRKNIPANKTSKNDHTICTVKSIHDKLIEQNYSKTLTSSFIGKLSKSHVKGTFKKNKLLKDKEGVADDAAITSELARTTSQVQSPNSATNCPSPNENLFSALQKQQITDNSVVGSDPVDINDQKTICPNCGYDLLEPENSKNNSSLKVLKKMKPTLSMPETIRVKPVDVNNETEEDLSTLTIVSINYLED